MKVVKPPGEEEEDWRLHPGRKLRHYVFVLDVTESMRRAMLEVKSTLQQIMADIDARKTQAGGGGGGGGGSDDDDDDEGRSEVVGTLVCFRDYFTPDSLDDLATGSAPGDADDTRAQLLAMLEGAKPDFLTCTFGPTSNFQWLAEQLDGLEPGGGDDWPEAISGAGRESRGMHAWRPRRSRVC